MSAANKQANKQTNKCTNNYINKLTNNANMFVLFFSAHYVSHSLHVSQPCEATGQTGISVGRICWFTRGGTQMFVQIALFISVVIGGRVKVVSCFSRVGIELKRVCKTLKCLICSRATLKTLFSHKLTTASTHRPLIAKANSQARYENFHPITIFESTRCELASWLLR